MEKFPVIVFVLALLLAGCVLNPANTPAASPAGNVGNAISVEPTATSAVAEAATPATTTLPPATPTPRSLSPEEEFWNGQVDAAFGPFDCPDAPARNLPQSSYRGPMFDAHVHFRSIPDGGPGSELRGENLGTGYKVAQWTCMLDYEGTSGALVFFPVWAPITRESIDVVKRTVEKYPGRFVPFIMPPANDGDPDGFPTVDAEELERMLSLAPGLFKGYGEIGLYARPGGVPALTPDSPRLTAIYPVVRKHNLTVYFHLGEDQDAAFERVLSANPDIHFIFHGDQLVDCGTCDQTPSRVAKILERHPNVYYGVDELYGDEFLLRPEVTKEKFIAHFKDYAPLLQKDLANWKDFIEAHPDQVLWDTDRGVGAPWSLDPDVALTLNDYSRAFIGRLDPSVQEKYAYRNAEKLFETKK